MRQAGRLTRSGGPGSDKRERFEEGSRVQPASVTADTRANPAVVRQWISVES